MVCGHCLREISTSHAARNSLLRGTELEDNVFWMCPRAFLNVQRCVLNPSTRCSPGDTELARLAWVTTAFEIRELQEETRTLGVMGMQ